VLSVIIFVRSATGIIAMPIVAALLGWAAWQGFAEKPERRLILAQALGVLLAFDTLTRMTTYVFTSSAHVNGKDHPSDIKNLADAVGGHYILWGMLITALALGMLWFGLWWAWRRPDRDARDANSL
jgi:hypothetical protein